MRKMTLARLREQVAFDVPAEAPDGSGGVEAGWLEQIANCKAHFRYLRGGETVQAARLEGRQPVVVTLQASAVTRAITSDWRMRDVRREEFDDDGVLMRGEYNIRAVVETEDRQWIEVTAETGVAV